MRYGTVVLLALAMGAAAVVPATGQEQTTLNSSYEVTVGDVAALIIPEFLKLNGNLTDPILVTFEPDPGVVDFEIFGAGRDVEGARQTMDQLRAFISSTVSQYLERRFSVPLPPSDYRIMYYNWTEEGAALVLIFNDGQYVMP